MDIYWIWLSQIKYVGPVLQKRLLAVFEIHQRLFTLPLKLIWKKFHGSVNAPLTLLWRIEI